MKPKKLQIKGLNSFLEKQTIDFERLTERGLFGIFGPTGSGKSTILDAITMALYGNIARDSSEFINISTDSLNISYEFEIGVENKRQDFIVDRTIKRDKNGRYKTKASRLVKKDGDLEIVVADKARDIQKNIENIIGLTSQDFTRSVVLPQGKFSEFLKLSGKARRDMLERIFGLEDFGKKLLDKIRKAKNKELSSMTLLSGKLEQYEGISKDSLKELEADLEEIKKEYDALKIKNKDIKCRYDKYKDVWNLQKDLNNHLTILKELENSKNDIDNKKNIALKARNALIVKPYVDDVKKTEDNIKVNKEELDKIQSLMDDIVLKVSEIEKEYNKAFIDKEELIPTLIEKENNTKQAIEKKESIAGIKKEREKLKIKYTKVKKEVEKLENDSIKFIDGIEKLDKNLKEKENEIGNLAIDYELRDSIQELLNLKREIDDINDNINTLNVKIKDKNSIISNNKNKYNNILEKQKKLEKNIFKLSNEENDLNSKNPGDSSILLDIQKNINTLEEKINYYNKILLEKSKNEKKLNLVLIKKKPIKEKFLNISKDIKDKNEKLCSLKNNLEDLEKESMASILASNLKENNPCPVCGSTNHVNLASKIDIEKLGKIKAIVKELELELESLRENQNSLNIKLVSFEKEEDIINDKLKNINEELKEYNIDLLEKNKNDNIKKFSKVQKSISDFEKSKSHMEERKDKLKEEKNKIDKEEITCKERSLKEKEILNSLIKDRDNYKVLLKEKNNSFNKIKNDKNIENPEIELKEIKINEKKIINFQNQCKKIREQLEKYKLKNQHIIDRKNKLEITKAKIVEVGKEKKNIIDKEEKEIKKLIGENIEGNLESYLLDIKEKIKFIKSNEENLKLKLSKETKEKECLKEKEIIKKQNKLNFEENILIQREKLKKSLKNNKFSSIDEVDKAYLKEECIIDIEKDIADFENKLNNENTNIKIINRKLNGNHIEKRQWEELLKEKENTEEEFNDIVKKVAVQEESIKNMKLKLKEFGDLLEKKKNIEHKKSLLEDIDKLVQGNKFVEFVATSQLKYIAFEASKRLKDITRGRYALELDSSSNFTIRDDFSGGAVRPTNTLSGGETFLTSLALALALSSQIQLKGNSPLEFFFLDEGFGSLDNDLLDIVMNSLEKIHTDKLSIGIISHVEELKDRVPVKLILEPAMPGEGGSKTRIEYS